MDATERANLIAWYRRNRERTRALFDVLTDDTYYRQPIALRNPIVFYDGHLPAFSFNTLVKAGLGEPGIDAKLESLFARGIDPAEAPDPADFDEVRRAWPSREAVRQFSDAADARVIEALEKADIEQAGHPLLDRAEAAFTILEHEAMHQETLLYMWHRLAFEQKRAPEGYAPRVDGRVPTSEFVDVGGGHVSLGVARGSIPFGWDNELPDYRVAVSGFAIERHNVTNAAFLEFVSAGGYREPRWWRPEDWAWITSQQIEHPLFWERQGDAWYWRGMFGLIPLPLSWPVYVSHAEASAYAAWKEARLPSEAEFQRAAYGTPGAGNRRFPWGDERPTEQRGVFDFNSWDPAPVDGHPAGESAWGVQDLVGNGWEWTSTVFGPFPGFQAMASYPQYSADFFDGEHYVMKGASPATATELLRPSFRNWFRPHYPYVYATFRCARDLA
jgi:gamma-glutamyl hercynylcysteine S-oxide synthase